MPQNCQNSQRGSSASANSFALLSEDLQHVIQDDADTIVVSSPAEPRHETRSGRPIKPSRKRQQQYSPPSPPPAPKRRTAKQSEVNDPVLGALARIEVALSRAEERAIRAEKRVEELENTVKSLVEQREAAHIQPPTSPTPPPAPIPTQLHAGASPFRLPGVNLDLSGAPHLRTLSPGELRTRVDECLDACRLNVRCIGVNVKEKDKIRVFFKGKDFPSAQKHVDKWVHAMAMEGKPVRVYGEQWFPIRVDRVKKSMPMNELGCTLFSKLNDVKVVKMRWLSRPAVEEEHGSVAVFLDEKEQADRILAENEVNMPGGEFAFSRVFETRIVPTRCFRCHEYGHTQLRCLNQAVCGQCAAKGHQAESCTSLVTKCAACHGPHRATDPGCAKFRKERRQLQSFLQ